MIGNRYRHIGRYRHIIMVFAKNGLESLLDQVGVLKYLKIRRLGKDNSLSKYKKMSIGARIRISLQELGPTFIKLGQILSTRPDFLAPDIIKELEKLQTDVERVPFSKIKSVIESEFGERIETLFKEFDEEPIAAASIAQVHTAKLTTGEKVVVKVQRPGIEKIIEMDIMILKDLSKFLDNHTKYGKLYDYQRMVFEFEKGLYRELDFRIEGNNAEKFNENFSGNKRVRVPNVSWKYTSRKVITMEYIGGKSLNEINDYNDVDKKYIAKMLSFSIFNQILKDGFFHADPHPGNVKVLNDKTIVFIDLGMVGHLDEEKKAQFLKMVMGVSFKNSKLIIQALSDLSVVNRSINSKAMEREIDAIRDKYLSVQLDEVKLGEAFNEIFKLAYNHKIRMPGEYAMLAKTLITLEGIAEKLDPELSVLEIAQPITKKLLYKAFSPKRIGRDIMGDFLEYRVLAKEFPTIMLNFMRKLEENDYTFQVSFKELNQIEKRINRIFNRVSYSIILLAVCLVIAGIMIGLGLSVSNSNQMYEMNITVLKITISIASVVVVALIYSIIK